MTVLFWGALDQAALSALEALCRGQRGRDSSVRLRLGENTTVEVGLIEALLRFEGVTVEAEEPSLALLIESFRGLARDTRRKP